MKKIDKKTIKNDVDTSNKYSSGGGALYNFLNKNIREFNPYIISTLCIIFLVLVGIISYKVNTTYAVFTDTIMGSKTIEITVDTCNMNKPNAPVLDDAMIPVYYDEDSETWKKADSTNKGNNWYDYCEKKWANSVTVSSTNRSTYKSASVGTEIPMDDILTMEVWIPRYKYKVWNYNADETVSSDPQEIEITFEKGTGKTGEITCVDSISGTDGDPSETCKIGSATCTDSTCNNKTYTHPAFTFGDEEIQGFWIGKFELTGTISNITVKPNLSSLRSEKISSFETNIMKMKNSGNQYGLSTSTDTHMIKNSEWGAVAYLSHSKYGTCTDGTCKAVSKNNSKGYYTGRSGGNSNSEASSEGTYKYNQTKNTVTEMIDEGTQITPTVTNDTTYPWTVSDGLYKSTTQGRNTNTTNLTFDFVAPSDDTYLYFDWSASTGWVSYNYLYYTITKDGTTLSDTGKSTKIGGTTLGSTESELTYKSVSKKLEKGTYQLTFTYKKTLDRSGGTDTGYVKNIKILNSPTFEDKVIVLKHGEDGPSASTTHNMYGVYDMSGGADDMTMANRVSPDGTTMISGVYSGDNSGYTGKMYNSGSYISFIGIDYPNSKYYDKYSFAESTIITKSSKLGDAMKEVISNDSLWYGGSRNLPVIGEFWFSRGGMFSVSYVSGDSYSYFGTRLIIIP